MSDIPRVAKETGRIVLPYFDPDTGYTGWQFGFPPVEGAFTNDSVQIRAFVKQTMQSHRQMAHFQTSKDGRGIPEWGWIQAESEEGPLEFVHLEAPTQGQGSIPITDIQDYRNQSIENSTFILTPQGAQHFGTKVKYPDFPYAIPVNESTTNDSAASEDIQIYSLSLNRAMVAICVASQDYILAALPTRAAYELRLWTSHLARILYLSETLGMHQEILLEPGQVSPDNQRLIEHTYRNFKDRMKLDC